MVYKVFVEVNEEGIEVVVVIGVGMMLMSLKLMFSVNYFFLFFIRYVRIGAILFFGRLMEFLVEV